jgi:hypothetical protein
MPYRPVPTPPNHFAELHQQQRHHAAQGMKESCMG